MEIANPLVLKGNVRRAIVLAAGKGRRLYPFTERTPKPLVKIADKEILGSLFEELIACGVNEVVVVTGHQENQLKDFLKIFEGRISLICINNSDYAGSNNVRSLWLAKEYFESDLLLLEADIAIKPGALREICLLPIGTSAAVISPLSPSMDGACVRVEGIPQKITPPKPLTQYESSAEALYKTVNIYRIEGGSRSTEALSRRLDEKIRNNAIQGYYEEIFADAIRAGEINFSPIIWSNQDWYEVDNADDLAIAEYIFSDAPDQKDRLRAEHGGYWRYPVVDHCLLYNCHYPTPKILHHLKNRIEPLTRHYPASQRPLSDFAAQHFGVAKDSIIIGNGVSEIIRALSRVLKGRLLLPSPSFDEYETLVPAENLVRFPLDANHGFVFPAKEIAQAVILQDIAQLVIVTPNNPTGVSMPMEHLVMLLDLLKDNPVKIIVDDSFLDFSNPRDSDLLLKILPSYPQLSVLRSLSKSHGIGGIRLGLMASSDTALINAVKNELPIWNINSFAEEYLRIMGAYRQEYLEACEMVKNEMSSLTEQLSYILGVRVFPSGANFVLCELSPDMPPAPVVASRLLDEYQIYVKDCSTKRMENATRYLRIASRTAKENRRLVDALNSVLHGQIKQLFDITPESRHRSTTLI